MENKGAKLFSLVALLVFALALFVSTGGGGYKDGDISAAVRRSSQTLKTVKVPFKVSQMTVLAGELVGNIESGEFSDETKKNFMADLSTILKSRKEEILKNAETNPNYFFDNLLHSSLVERISESPELRLDIERPVNISGDLRVYIAEDFRGKSTTLHVLKTGEIAVPLYFRAGQEPSAMSGSTISGTGYSLDGSVFVDNFTLPSVSKPGHTEKKTAGVLLSFTNAPVTESLRTETRAAIFTGSPSSKEFYPEASFGNLTIVGKNDSQNGDIFDVSLPYSNSPCNQYQWSDDAISQIPELLQYDLTQYVFVQNSCSWAGFSSLDGSTPVRSYVNGFQKGRGTVSHEFGHSLGLYHAASLSCSSGSLAVPLAFDCTGDEYGDRYEIMGDSTSYKHFNAFSKRRVNWYDDSRIAVVPSAAGTYTYTIKPIENSTTGTLAVKIPLRDRTFPSYISTIIDNGFGPPSYYIEYRRPFGYDNFSSTENVVNGASIRIAATDPAYPRKTFALDMTPDSNSDPRDDFKDLALTAGKVFEDKWNNVKVKTVSVNLDGAVIEVTVGSYSCARANPKVYVKPETQDGYRGQSLSYNVAVRNMDTGNCGSSTFDLTAVLPPGFTQSPATLGSSTIYPGELSAVQSVSVTSGSGAVAGANQLRYLSKNLADSGFSGYGEAVYNLIAQCGDGIDNADPEDTLADASDKGCHTDANAGNAASYSSSDDNEEDSAPPPGPGDNMKVFKTGSGKVTSSPAGIDCGLDCSQNYPLYTYVKLTATADAGNKFSSWSGACTGSSPTCTILITGPKSATANFVPTTSTTYTLTVSKSGTGSGTVISNPVGINCGTDCTENYNSGTSVALTATASSGSAFAGWSGACSGTLPTCTVLMNSAKNVTATFNLSSGYTLTVTKSGTGSGTVTSSPVGINCGTDCSENYAANTVVTLTAKASSGSVFTAWSGACSGFFPICTVIMNSAKTVNANFK